MATEITKIESYIDTMLQKLSELKEDDKGKTFKEQLAIVIQKAIQDAEVQAGVSVDIPAISLAVTVATPNGPGSGTATGKAVGTTSSVGKLL